NIDTANAEDVSDRFRLLAEGNALRSRLAWADSLRNVRVFEEIEELEPILHLDIGCGISHPLGRFIINRGLDTHYVGVDFVRERVLNVASDTGNARSFVGVHHDCREPL